ncbi:ATP-binding protein [Mediterraneibacter gnavus]|uniref:ATP-binding protein n=1 Tax=Mediterraneibacter gnavus TaxID=33038 RepID=UPI00232D4666|nr:AAA family ATPase [Mediterraneibacter gnavus]MDB8710986.1 AAA family ATPase [Mediterraneibacter gnavus]MDB8714262.1 AAA family ATPase [Mediterraneibacter gnavus]
MLDRTMEKKIEKFFKTEPKSALMITGARQVGKTYCIRQFARKHFESVIEINFLEMPQAITLFENARNSEDILLRISALTDIPLIKGKTLIFFDEVQECKEIVTAIKFLVDEGSYRYILSGSLLGVELKDIRSVPVGYMTIYEMFPLDFFEFCKANRVSDKVLDKLEECFEQKQSIDSLIHEKMMDLFRLYLIVGGMPAAVQRYLQTNNLNEVLQIQTGIIQLYKKDIAKYDPNEKLYLEDIFQLIPSELNSKNKRFILKNLNEHFKFSRYEHSFIWLKEAGVALPVFCAQEPRNPLLLSKATNMFKLFLSDVGLLAAMYADGIQVKILNKEKDINFGSVYENAVAQELRAHGFDLYYFNNKKQGELDFVIEYQGGVLPIEVKSGKNYMRHRALDNVLKNPQYEISEAIVFCNENIQEKDGVLYCPIYLAGLLKKQRLPEDYIYQMDLSILQDA